MAIEGVDWGTLGSVGIATTALGSALTWIWTRGGKAALLAQRVTDAEKSTAAANARADAAEKAHDTLRTDLHTHLLADATSFTKLEGLATEATRATTASETRLTNAIEGLGARMDTMTKRFDDFLAIAINGKRGNGRSRS